MAVVGDAFLDPRCRPGSVDRFVHRRAILAAVKEVLPDLRGRLLDVGCGSMPYRDLLLAPPSRVREYIGLDLEGSKHGAADLRWDGVRIPLEDESTDAVIATEVLEHCPDPGAVLRECRRVLRHGEIFFCTVPFVWPLHEAPFDYYRYTPFAVERLLREAGFTDIRITALGGWDASLAQLLGLWARRRPVRPILRSVLSLAVVPLVRTLLWIDRKPEHFEGSCMPSGLAARCVRSID